MAINDGSTRPQAPVVVTGSVLGRDGKLRGSQPHGPIYFDVPDSNFDVGTFDAVELSAPAANRVALTGNIGIRSMAAGGLTVSSETPLPPTTDDPAIFSNW